MKKTDTLNSSAFARSACKMSIILAASVACAQGSGYKIPEQSLSAMALSAANIAAVDGADASYYNPANMVFLSNPKSELEFLLTYVNLPRMNYEDNRNPLFDSTSEVERFIAPTFHFVTPEYYKDWRLGFSTVVPGGLAKRWNDPYAASTAKKFALKIIEANPTAAYKIADWVSIGFGLRAVYSTGEIETYANSPATFGQDLSMDMKGDSFDFGYNLALSVRPIESLKLAATYRSKIDLTVEGDAKLKFPGMSDYNGPGGVTVPLPAVLDIAAAYTFGGKTTLEVVYERVFWSAYKDLDFNFGAGAPPLFEQSKPKDWKNSNAYRIGLSHWVTDSLKLMAGFTIDKSPVPDKSLGFELPDSNAKNYSGGFEYKINEDFSIGAAYLYSDKAQKAIKNSELDGEFKDGGAHLMNLSFKYRF